MGRALQLVLHLIAIGAIGGLLALALRGEPMPRTPVDLPLLGLMAALALATPRAVNLGMSLRAMAAIVATALMLPVALLAVRHRPLGRARDQRAGVRLATATLVAMVARRVEWILVGAPGFRRSDARGDDPVRIGCRPAVRPARGLGRGGRHRGRDGPPLDAHEHPRRRRSAGDPLWVAFGVAGDGVAGVRPARAVGLAKHRGSAARRWRPSRRALIVIAGLASSSPPSWSSCFRALTP